MLRVIFSAVTDRVMNGRCSRTSFSRMHSSLDSPFASISLSFSRRIICWRVVFFIFLSNPVDRPTLSEAPVTPRHD